MAQARRHPRSKTLIQLGLALDIPDGLLHSGNEADGLCENAELGLRAARTGDAAAHLREGLRAAVRTSLRFDRRTGLALSSRLV